MADTTFSWTELSWVASVTDQENVFKIGDQIKRTRLVYFLTSSQLPTLNLACCPEARNDTNTNCCPRTVPLYFCWVTERVVSGVLGFEPCLSSSMFWSFSHLHLDSVHPKHPYSTCSTGNKSHAVVSFVFLLFISWCLVISFWLKVCIYSHTRGVKLGLGLGFMQTSQVLPHWLNQ